MTKQFREAALFTRPDPEAEALRLALLDWRARLLVAGYVPRSAASALLEAHGRDVVSYEAGRSDDMWAAFPGGIPYVQFDLES